MNVDDEGAGGRRQFLKYVLAGTAGGIATAGIDQLLEEDDSGFEGPSSYPNGSGEPFDAFVYEQNGGYVAVDTVSETTSSGSDGWSVLENAIDAVPAGGSIYVSGRYVSTSTIEINKPIHMNGQEAFIDHRTSDDFVFRFEGEERHQTTLAEAASTGDNTVVLNNMDGIQKGDMVLLEEVDGDPVLGREKPPSEPHSVLEVDGNSVVIEDSIVWRGGYPAETRVYVFDPIEVHASGFDMAAPAKDEDYYGVTAHICHNATFENLRLDKFGSRGILLEACANVRVRDCTVRQSSDIDAADGYGIQVWAGCHDIIVEGCSAKECRHPLAVTAGGGRSVASRAITFRDCFATANGAAALDCHGGSAHDVRFEGCRVHTWGEAGVRTGAQKTVLSGCEFRMDGNNAIDTRGDGQEMILVVEDTDVYGATNAVKLSQEEDLVFSPLWKFVQVDGVRAYGCNQFFSLGGGAIDRVRDLTIRGCYWDEVADYGLRFRNQLDSGLITSNNFGRAPNNSHVIAGDHQNTAVRNLYIVGNHFQQPAGNDAFIRLSRSEQCVVSENNFSAESDVNIYVEDSSSTANMVIENKYYAPSPSDDPVSVNDGSIDRDNSVYDTNAGRGL